MYERELESVALAIWEISTGNGHKLDNDLWDSHMQNCYAAAANTYYEGVDLSDWLQLALSKVSGQ